MNKIDGIQKISKEELKKRREIILGMLGDDSVVKRSANKKVDGVLLSKKAFIGDVDKEVILAAEKKHIEDREKAWPMGSVTSGLSNADHSVGNVINNDSLLIQNPDYQKIEMPKSAIRSKKKKEAITSKKKIAFLQLFKDKFGNYQKTVSIFVKNIANVFHEIAKKFYLAFKKFIFISLVAILVFNILYIFLFLLIIEYNIDNKFFRFLSEYLPIPAIIVNNKFINYYDYVDLKNKFGNDIEVRKDLISDVIKKDFFLQYGVSDVEVLNKYIVNNLEANSVSLNRIKKIKEQIDNGGDFDEIAGRYGDRRESIEFSAVDYDNYDYGDKIKNLNVGEVSDIIFSKDGYYLFKCYKKSDEVASLSYVFIQAKDFNEYVSNAANNVYYVSFID